MKNRTNVDRKRVFPSDKLSVATSSGKWTHVKLIVTQPYALSTPLGLSSVDIEGIADEAEAKGMEQ